MKKFNKKLAITLTIVCIISCAANFFGIFTTPTIAINFIVGAFVAFITMMQVYHYQNYQDYNPGTFWLIFSSLGGTILVAIFYGMSFKLISESLSTAIIIGLSPTLLPVLGLFIGNCGRILKSEESII